jgi:pimeloyl-ACP methyl ester carboxylesterase
MANIRRPQAATVATALLAGSAVAAAAMLARRKTSSVPAAAAPRQLTPFHRGGTGEPLLLLHGIAATWRVWSPVLPYLEPYHDVIAPTLPGHGGGPPLDPGVAPSVGALVDGVEAQLDRLGLQTVHIAGNSLGGWIGIELARRGRAKSLILFSPAGSWRSSRVLKATAVGVRFSLGAMARYSGSADAIAARRPLRYALLAGQVAHPHLVSQEDLADFIYATGHAPVVDPLLRVIHNRPVDPLPADRDYPVRLVWGEHDRVLPFKSFAPATMDRLPGAHLIPLSDAGHVPMSDNPVRVAELILEVTRAADSAAVPLVSN